MPLREAFHPLSGATAWFRPPRETADLHVHKGRFRLAAISKPRGWSDVITVGLRSLARNWKGPPVAVIVSGLDGDGSAALRGIKAVGRTTIAQDPISAIGTGYVDFILTPEKIGQTIAALARRGSAFGFRTRISGNPASTGLKGC